MIQFSLKPLKRKLKKRLLFLPVTRVEVLQYAKELQSTDDYRGLCDLLHDALDQYGIWPFASTIFPKFRPKYARQFGTYIDYGYWWEVGRWDTGRLDYLDWLINEYRNDKTNIRKL